MDCARKHGRYGHRDATMMLVAYRHGLRASEVCDLQWQQIELSEGRLHVDRVKNGIASVHRSAVTRCEHCVSYAATTPKTPTYSFPSAGGPLVQSVSTGSSSASARLPRCPFRSTHTCCVMPVVSSSPTMAIQKSPLSAGARRRAAACAYKNALRDNCAIYGAWGHPGRQRRNP